MGLRLLSSKRDTVSERDLSPAIIMIIFPLSPSHPARQIYPHHHGLFFPQRAGFSVPSPSHDPLPRKSRRMTSPPPSIKAFSSFRHQAEENLFAWRVRRVSPCGSSRCRARARTSIARPLLVRSSSQPSFSLFLSFSLSGNVLVVEARASHSVK